MVNQPPGRVANCPARGLLLPSALEQNIHMRYDERGSVTRYIYTRQGTSPPSRCRGGRNELWYGRMKCTVKTIDALNRITGFEHSDGKRSKCIL